MSSSSLALYITKVSEYDGNNVEAVYREFDSG